MDSPERWATATDNEAVLEAARLVLGDDAGELPDADILCDWLCDLPNVAAAECSDALGVLFGDAIPSTPMRRGRSWRWIIKDERLWAYRTSPNRFETVGATLALWGERHQEEPDVPNPFGPFVSAWAQRNDLPEPEDEVPTFDDDDPREPSGDDADLQPAPSPKVPVVHRSVAVLTTKSTDDDRQAPALVKVPNVMITAALASWEESPDVDAVSVDDLPIATMEATRPVRAQRPKRVIGTQGELFRLPGTKAAESMVLQRMQWLERDGIDHRSPLPSDVYFMLSLACGMTGSADVDIDTIAAWLAGKTSTEGMRPDRLQPLRERAWAALSYSRTWFRLPSGHYTALLDVNTVNMPQGVVRLTSWDWSKAKGLGWRLTGAVANVNARSTGPQGCGTFARIVAGIEDYINASGPVGQGGIPELLVAQGKGGPGPVRFIPYPEIMARAGFVWDDSSTSAMKKLWLDTCNRFEAKGYELPKSQNGIPILNAEAQVGDTIEIVEVVKGNRRGPGGVRVRASARFIEGRIRASRKGGFTPTPLRDVFGEGKDG